MTEEEIKKIVRETMKEVLAEVRYMPMNPTGNYLDQPVTEVIVRSGSTGAV